MNPTEPTSLAPVGTSAAAETRNHRAALTWVDDGDLRTLESKDTGAAWALSMFFGGGGQLYTGQYLMGAGLIAADLVLLWLFWPLYFALGAVSSVMAFRAAKQINRYVAARDAQDRSSGPTPAEYRLLSAMSAADPNARYDAAKMHAMGLSPTAGGSSESSGPATPLNVAGIDVGKIKQKLEQLAALRQNQVIDDAEYRERRIDTLRVLQGLSRDEMDDVLYHLIPLINQGYLSNEDIQFVKQMGGG